MLKTIYKENITLLEGGDIPIRLRPNIEKILEKLISISNPGKMSTFCISTYSCKLHITTIQSGDFNKTLDNAKKNKFRHVLVIRTNNMITAILLDNGKVIDREPINATTLTKNIHAAILEQPDGLLDANQAKNLLDMMDGILFKGLSPHQYKYRVAVSGFGSLEETKAAQKHMGQFCTFIPFSDAASRRISSSTSPTHLSTNEDGEFPDTDMLHIFIRFLTEATVRIDRGGLKDIEDKFKVKLDQQKVNIKNIKTLLNNEEFYSLLKSFNKEHEEEYSPIEFLVTLLFKFNKFNYIKYINNKSIQIDSYLLPVELPAAERAALLSAEDQNSLENYRLTHVTGEHIFSKTYESLKKIAKENSVDFDCLDGLFTLLTHSSSEALARRIGHCSEDALLDYIKVHSDEFLPSNSQTYIFSIKIPALDFDKMELVIHECCNICRLHFDEDLANLLKIKNNEITVEDIPNTDIPVIPDFKSKSSEIFFSFKPGSSGVYNALLGNSMDPNSGEIFGEDKHLDKMLDQIAHVYNFSKEHSNRLIAAAAKGNISQVQACLNEMQNGTLPIDINAKNKDDGNTALHYAAMVNASATPKVKCKIMILLLMAGANPLLVNTNGHTAAVLFGQFTEKQQRKEGIFSKTANKMTVYISKQQQTIVPPIVLQWLNVANANKLENKSIEHKIQWEILADNLSKLHRGML